jgi:hypothetical protein
LTLNYGGDFGGGLLIHGSGKILGKFATNGLDPNSGFPNGWGGGFRTYDLQADGAIHTNGSVNADGIIYSKQELYTTGRIGAEGEIRSNNKISAAGQIYSETELYTTGRIGAEGEIRSNNKVTAPNVCADNGVCLVTNSDIRLKENIEPITDAISKLGQLNGVTYDWKDSQRGTEQQVGVIAQDVEKVLPQVVHTDEQGYKTVEYSKLTSLLIEAVKEQQKQIDELKNKVELLENK